VHGSVGWAHWVGRVESARGRWRARLDLFAGWLDRLVGLGDGSMDRVMYNVCIRVVRTEHIYRHTKSKPFP
jgi:hypothetical protein